MKTEAREAVLSPADVKTILGLCSAEGVLVGGQALAFWVDHLGVRRPQELESRGARVALKLLERVAAVAAEPGAVRIFLLYGIDPLNAIPLEDFRTNAALHTKRWPQITEQVSAQREKMRRLIQTAKSRRK